VFDSAPRICHSKSLVHRFIRSCPREHQAQSFTFCFFLEKTEGYCRGETPEVLGALCGHRPGGPFQKGSRLSSVFVASIFLAALLSSGVLVRCFAKTVGLFQAGALLLRSWLIPEWSRVPC